MTDAGGGGRQHIPRPPGARPGPHPPWRLARPVTLGDVRRAVTGRRGVPVPTGMPDPGGQRRTSAVLVAVHDAGGGRAGLILTRRSWDLRHHTGEVSFPGGRVEPGETPVQAALREAHEEIDLDPVDVEPLGELDHLATVTSRSVIVPVVGVVHADPSTLRPNPAEVDDILLTTLDELASEEVFRTEVWPFGEAERPMHFFELDGDTVWGATARMIHQLLELITEARSTGGPRA